jgi:hypothetical protein
MNYLYSILLVSFFGMQAMQQDQLRLKTKKELKQEIKKGKEDLKNWSMDEYGECDNYFSVLYLMAANLTRAERELKELASK